MRPVAQKTGQKGKGKRARPGCTANLNKIRKDGEASGSPKAPDPASFGTRIVFFSRTFPRLSDSGTGTSPTRVGRAGRETLTVGGCTWGPNHARTPDWEGPGWGLRRGKSRKGLGEKDKSALGRLDSGAAGAGLYQFRAGSLRLMFLIDAPIDFSSSSIRSRSPIFLTVDFSSDFIIQIRSNSRDSGNTRLCSLTRSQ